MLGLDLQAWGIVVGMLSGLATVIGSATKLTRRLRPRQTKRSPRRLSRRLSTSIFPKEPVDQTMMIEQYWDGRLYLVDHPQTSHITESRPRLANNPLEAPPLILLNLANEYATKRDPNRAIVLLDSLLLHSDADAEMLQEGGYIARKILRQYKLSHELYSRALRIDPSQVRTQLGLLIMDAKREKTDGGFLLLLDDIIDIARNYSNDRRIVSDVTEFLLEDRKAFVLLELASDLISSGCPFQSLLWMATAKAQRLIDEEPGVVIHSYESAIDEARKERRRTGNGVRDLVDCLVSLSKYLIVIDSVGNFQTVTKLLGEAQKVAPSDPSPEWAFAELYRSVGRDHEAQEREQRARILTDMLESNPVPPISPSYGETRLSDSND